MIFQVRRAFKIVDYRGTVHLIFYLFYLQSLVGEPLSDEEGAVSGMPAPAPSSMTAQKHLKALSDAIDAASELTTEKRASKRVSLRNGEIYKRTIQNSALNKSAHINVLRRKLHSEDYTKPCRNTQLHLNVVI